MSDTETKILGQEIRLNENKPYSTNSGDMTPDDPLYRVAYFQGRKVKSQKTKKMIMVLLPFDAQGDLVPDDKRQTPFIGIGPDGKPTSYHPLWDDDMRHLLAKLEEEARERAEGDGDDEADVDMDWVTDRVDFVGFLTGAASYEWSVVQAAAKKRFSSVYGSKRDLVVDLVVERKVVSPERVSPALAKYLPKAA